MNIINKYFINSVNIRSKCNKKLYYELAKREVETLFFLIAEFYKIKFIDKDLKVVDIGCGDQFLKTHFEYRNFKYYGYDINNLDIEKDSLPNQTNSVDIVVNLGLIEALKNPSNLLSESYRILKPGGFIYTITPNWKKDYKNFYDNPIHRTPYTPLSLEKLLKSIYGFKDIKTFPGLRCKNKWFYKGKYRFEKAYYLFPFLQINNGSWFDLIRKFLPTFLKGHARSIIAIGKK